MLYLILHHIERQEGFDKDNPSSIDLDFLQKVYHLQVMDIIIHQVQEIRWKYIFFDNYEMAHFRLLTDTNFLPYGRSYIEPARKLFKQYTLMEGCYVNS